MLILSRIFLSTGGIINKFGINIFSKKILTNLTAISKYLFIRLVRIIFTTYCLYSQAAKAKIEYLCK